MMKLQDVLLKAMAKKITWWDAAVQRDVLRPEHPALPREVGGGARHPTELYVGAKGAAGSRIGGPRQEATQASAAEGASTVGGDAAAHRWEQASVVWGRALVRLDRDSGRC